MRVECMCCETVLGEKEGGGEPTSGICDPCLELNYPKEAPKVKAYRCCSVCPDRTLKCHLIACDGLSEILDLIDIRLKQEGL